MSEVVGRRYVDVRRVAERWGVSTWTVRRLMRRELPYLRIGGRVLLDMQEIEQFEEARRVRPA